MTHGIILLAVPYIASFQYWIIDIIQLMHSFEVTSGFVNPRTVNITYEGS